MIEMKVKNELDHKVALYVGKVAGIPQRQIVRPGEVVDVENINPRERYLEAALMAGLTPMEKFKEEEPEPEEKKPAKKPSKKRW